MRLGGRVCVIGALALGAAMPAAAVAAPSANDVSFEADTATWSPSTPGHQISDGAAHDGYAYAAYANATGTKTVTTTGSSIRVAVTARGQQCNGAPHMTVSVDGSQVLSVDVTNASAYSEYSADLYAPAGSHTVAVSFTNDFMLVCDRNLYVDTVTLNGQPFSLSSYRNNPLDANAPIDSNSMALVQTLDAIKNVGNGPWVNTTRYTEPVYTVPANQATVRVSCPSCNSAIQQYLTAVPLPSDAQMYNDNDPVNGDTDSAAIVYQPSTDLMWDFWRLQPPLVPGGAWTAGNAGYMAGVSGQTARFSPPSTGGSATAIPFLMGLQRFAEVKAGVIDHAVDLAIPHGCITPNPGWVWPAQRGDGGWSSSDPVCGSLTPIPEGTRFRLPANEDLSGLSGYALTLARAVQKYGMVVTDGSGNIAFYAERQHQIKGTGGVGSAPDQWAGLANGPEPPGKSPAQVLAAFPWSHLQVVAVPANPF